MPTPRLPRACLTGNFTPSLAADIPALTTLAERRNVPVAGKDGKTGQTFIKTVLAPAFRSRSLYVEGWFSTNILGNRDGLALDNPDSLKSKLNTKGSVLDDILGYPVEDHIVDIRYYKPRGGQPRKLGTTSTSSASSARRCRSRSTSFAATAILAGALGHRDRPGA